ncbi:MAG: lactate utilization protein [Nitrococcus sp.]|nr:lactate utilization protein [Nitrococcus sp.]
MTSSPECPSANHFLPDDHLIVLQAHHVVDYLEAVWERLQAPGQGMPRAVNLITGPSRTTDVGQNMRLSAHGPAASTCCCLPDRLAIRMLPLRPALSGGIEPQKTPWVLSIARNRFLCQLQRRVVPGPRRRPKKQPENAADQ